METFTLIPELAHQVEHRKAAKRTTVETGAVKTRLTDPRGLPRRWVLRWAALDDPDMEYLSDFWDRRDGYVESFNWTTLEPRPTPSQGPVVAAGAAGSLNGPFDVAMTYKTSLGETKRSPIVTSVALVNEKLKVTAPRFYADIQSIRVYAAVSGSPVKRQTTEITTSLGSVEYDSLDTTTDPPATNDAFEALTVRFVDGSLAYTWDRHRYRAVTVQVEEAYP